ncbi:MAG: dihydropteroate synthase [Prolixibacteraceae bacterium]
MLINPPEKNYFVKKNTIRYNGELISLNKPLVMGILNVTPDSFYDGGRYSTIDDAVNHVGNMLAEGAGIIDVGACSTRPGASEVGAEQELKRLLPVVRQIKRTYPTAILSVDTFHSRVAETLIGEFGDFLINDISGGAFDANMFKTVAKLRVPYILMHVKGTSISLHKNASYENVTKEVIKQLSEGVYRLHELGVNDVIIDPGFGFSKTLDHNYEMLNHLDAFRFFELPVLVGISRKSMIYKLFDADAEDSLNATTVLNTLALQSGANILRVHDVKAAVEAVHVFEKIKEFAK